MINFLRPKKNPDTCRLPLLRFACAFSSPPPSSGFSTAASTGGGNPPTTTGVGRLLHPEPNRRQPMRNQYPAIHFPMEFEAAAHPPLPHESAPEITSSSQASSGAHLPRGGQARGREQWETGEEIPIYHLCERGRNHRRKNQADDGEPDSIKDNKFPLISQQTSSCPTAGRFTQHTTRQKSHGSLRTRTSAATPPMPPFAAYSSAGEETTLMTTAPFWTIRM
ncbi:hypothetical protein Taro_053401 [Colocasia esculenta]|uniref:Uncharacterized protein n=1 Tax=Colocasia esculenta TaxID=4460 RepID=A0A843XMH2_COLES|nr:hypothetical protein [Colocasia esculenta]